MKPLSGSLAFVTGTSRGIGSAIANTLQKAGAKVIGLSRSPVPPTGEWHTNIQCDLADADEISRAVRQLLELGVPDIVVNNAGAFLIKPVAETTAQDFDQQIAINLRAPFLLLQGLLPHLIRKGYAQVVSIGSIADHVPFPGNAAYAASKYGLRGLHEVIRKELAGTDVRTTLISPGPTDTELWDSIDPDHSGDLLDREEMLVAEDVAEAVLFAVTRPQRVNIELVRLGPGGVR